MMIADNQKMLFLFFTPLLITFSGFQPSMRLWKYEKQFLPSWNVAKRASCLTKPVSTKGAFGKMEAMMLQMTRRSFLSCRS